MAIIKIHKKENPFIQIDKRGIEDERLSWGATGLLTYLIGLPENWVISIEHLKNIKKDKRDATRNFLNELRETEYCHYYELREQGKIIENIYLIFEVPTSSDEAAKLIKIKEGQKLFYREVRKNHKINNSPFTENPFTVEPFTENPTLLIIDNNNNNNNNKTNNHGMEMDIFENLFKELGIKFTAKNQASTEKLLSKMNTDEVIQYLKETYINLSLDKSIINLGGVFSKKIANGERQMAPKIVQAVNSTDISEIEIIDYRAFNRKQKIETMEKEINDIEKIELKEKIKTSLTEENDFLDLEALEKIILEDYGNVLIKRFNKKYLLGGR